MAAPTREHQHDHFEGSELSDTALRVRALESLLVEKGLVDPAALDALVDTYETKVGPHTGARIVARSWLDAGFRRRLLADATAAAEEIDYAGPPIVKLVAL